MKNPYANIKPAIVNYPVDKTIKEWCVNGPKHKQTPPAKIKP